MRTCYFLQTHTNPEQIHRLVRTLKHGSPGARILIGHDASGCELDLAPLSDLSGIDLFRVDGPLDRAGLSVLTPYLTALDWLTRQAVDFDWLVYLSGQDYPVLPIPEIEGFLETSGRDGFLSYWDIGGDSGFWGESRRGLRRYLYQYRPASPWVGHLKRLNSLRSRYHVSTAYGPRLGTLANPSPFNPAFPCYAGDQWHALARPAVEALRRAVHRDGALIEYFRHTLCPCEAVVQTLLVNERGEGHFDLENDSRRYVDWSGSRDGRPRVLTEADFATITSGRYHFARKVDSRVDGRLLDRLDERVLYGR